MKLLSLIQNYPMNLLSIDLLMKRKDWILIQIGSEKMQYLNYPRVNIVIIFQDLKLKEISGKKE